MWVGVGEMKVVDILNDLKLAEAVKHIPCACGRKSVARLRFYDNDQMVFRGYCRDHLSELKEFVRSLQC